MSDPYRNETMAQLIVRKPGNLNILVTAQQRGSCAHYVLVRYNYTELYLPDDPRLTRVIVYPIGERWNPDAINSANDKGAFERIPNVPGIVNAIAELKKIWGDIPVHDNSDLLDVAA